MGKLKKNLSLKIGVVAFPHCNFFDKTKVIFTLSSFSLILNVYLSLTKLFLLLKEMIVYCFINQQLRLAIQIFCLFKRDRKMLHKEFMIQSEFMYRNSSIK